MSDKNRYLAKILLLGIICFAALTLAAVIPSPVSTVADAAVLATPSEKDCEILCDDSVTPYCESNEHLAWNPDEPGVTWLNGMRRLGSHPYTCYEGSCASEHDEGLCEIVPAGEGEPLLTPESTEELRQAVLAADATGVQALLKAHPSQLSFNVKRSAIQIMACNGRVREHILLPNEMVRQLVVVAH
jgi:hypothetical protein